MEVIGVVVREITYLKVLQPIMDEFIKLNIPYILYHFDAPRSEKEYNRASLINIKKSSSIIAERAFKVRAFNNDNALLNQIVSDKITKLVSIEIYLWAKDYIHLLKQAKIKLYSLLYLSDSLWNSDPKCITSMDRIYYTTSYLKETHLNFLNLKEDPNRDRLLGSPIFDCLNPSTGDSVLVLLPNLKSEHVGMAFGNETNFISIIKKLSQDNNLIFKTRQKQWLPKQIKDLGKVIMDGDIMYPPVISDILKQTHTTIMFYSSGIYEAVWAGQYVVNIPISLKRWGWDKNKMNKYFSNDEDSLYNFNGVVESVSQEQILNGNWKLINKLDREQRQKWIKKYIGKQMGARFIVEDIIKV